LARRKHLRAFHFYKKDLQEIKISILTVLLRFIESLHRQSR